MSGRHGGQSAQHRRTRCRGPRAKGPRLEAGRLGGWEAGSRLEGGGRGRSGWQSHRGAASPRRQDALPCDDGAMPRAPGGGHARHTGAGMAESLPWCQQAACLCRCACTRTHTLSHSLTHPLTMGTAHAARPGEGGEQLLPWRARRGNGGLGRRAPAAAPVTLGALLRGCALDTRCARRDKVSPRPSRRPKSGDFERERPGPGGDVVKLAVE